MLVLNDLYDYGLKIYQDPDSFKFSLDSLLLAEYVDITKNDKTLIDFCTGNAPLPLIIASKTNLTITGIELQKDIYDCALKSIKYNKLENRINILNMNVLDTNNYFPGNNFDLVTCNPPFFKINETSLLNTNSKKALARHELSITLPDIINRASYLLKDKGKFYLVHRPDRIEEIILLAKKNNLSLKKLELILSNPEKDAIMVLFKFVKNGNSGTKIHSTIVNRDTKTYQNIFKKKVN